MKLIVILTGVCYIELAYTLEYIVGKEGHCTTKEFQRILDETTFYDKVTFGCTEDVIVINETIVIKQPILVNGAGKTIISKVGNGKVLFNVIMSNNTAGFETVVIQNMIILMTDHNSTGIFIFQQGIHTLISNMQFSSIDVEYNAILTKRCGKVKIVKSKFIDSQIAARCKFCKAFTFNNNVVSRSSRGAGKIFARTLYAFGKIELKKNKIENGDGLSEKYIVLRSRKNSVNFLNNVINNMRNSLMVVNVFKTYEVNIRGNKITNTKNGKIFCLDSLKILDFKSNTIKDNDVERTVWITKSENINVTSNQFIDNKCTKHNLLGHTIDFFTIKNNLFFRNTAELGGGIQILRTKMVESVGNGFIKNVASSKGNAIYLKDVGQLTSVNDLFAANGNDNELFNVDNAITMIKSAVIICNTDVLTNANSPGDKFQMESSIIGSQDAMCTSSFIKQSLFLKTANEGHSDNCGSNSEWSLATLPDCSNFNREPRKCIEFSQFFEKCWDFPSL